MRHLLVINTGGAIGLTPRGSSTCICPSYPWLIVPEPEHVRGELAATLRKMYQFSDPSFPAQDAQFTTPEDEEGRRLSFDLDELDPLLDSSFLVSCCLSVFIHVHHFFLY